MKISKEQFIMMLNAERKEVNSMGYAKTFDPSRYTSLMPAIEKAIVSRPGDPPIRFKVTERSPHTAASKIREYFKLNENIQERAFSVRVVDGGYIEIERKPSVEYGIQFDD